MPYKRDMTGRGTRRSASIIPIVAVLFYLMRS